MSEKAKISKTLVWSLILFSVLGIYGLIAFFSGNIESQSAKNELGTFKTPEEAFEETQKALNLLSENINSGMENAQYINEYENTKNKVFKKEK
ncbi:hypothetical protein NAT51_16980 [Flavobacterium amniphilum]|uniref:hypothetical protein n=1 Tax=Flavobacterium amniphilum TaxID=1834035 RepID=UPI00202A5666|nr:hypothetical protein [Flavobacterium amniphilum]MCL9807228.1 hypothetical protein [Flavobacterium amniphilum]